MSSESDGGRARNGSGADGSGPERETDPTAESTPEPTPGPGRGPAPGRAPGSESVPEPGPEPVPALGPAPGSVSGGVLGGVPGTSPGAGPGVPYGANAARVLGLLRSAGEQGADRGELALRTGLTPQAVSKITARLRSHGLVTEAGRRASTGGKPSTVLRLAPSARHAVGVQLDRDQLTAVLVDLSGGVVAGRTAPLDLGADADALLDAVESAVHGLIAAALPGTGDGRPRGRGGAEDPAGAAGGELWRQAAQGEMWTSPRKPADRGTRGAAAAAEERAASTRADARRAVAEQGELWRDGTEGVTGRGSGPTGRPPGARGPRSPAEPQHPGAQRHSDTPSDERKPTEPGAPGSGPTGEGRGSREAGRTGQAPDTRGPRGAVETWVTSDTTEYADTRPTGERSDGPDGPDSRRNGQAPASRGARGAVEAPGATGRRGSTEIAATPETPVTPPTGEGPDVPRRAASSEPTHGRGSREAREREPTGPWDLAGTADAAETADTTDAPDSRSSGARWGSVVGVGVAAPGPLDHVRGVLGPVTGLPGWTGFPLRDALARRLGLPVVLDKDTNAAALGLAPRGRESLAYLHFGTGVGAGLVLDGRIHRGRRTGAGEFGHQVLQLDGPRCRCGRHGCLEVLCMDAVRNGRPAEAARLLGVGAANLVRLLDIDRVLLGGRTVLAAPDTYVDGVAAQLRAETGTGEGPDAVRVELVPEGARTVADGAAQLVLAPLFGQTSDRPAG